MLQDMEMRLSYTGMNLEKYLQMTNTSIDLLREQYKDSAYNRVKTQLVLEALVKAEAIVVTDEDREKEYEKMAEQYKMNVEDIKKTFGTNTEQMDYSIQVQKTIDMLMNEAVIVEKVIDQDKEEKNKEEKSEDSED